MPLDDSWEADQTNLAQAPSYILTQGHTDRSLAVTGKRVIATAQEPSALNHWAPAIACWWRVGQWPTYKDQVYCQRTRAPPKRCRLPSAAVRASRDSSDPEPIWYTTAIQGNIFHQIRQGDDELTSSWRSGAWIVV